MYGNLTPIEKQPPGILSGLYHGNQAVNSFSICGRDGLCAQHAEPTSMHVFPGWPAHETDFLSVTGKKDRGG